MLNLLSALLLAVAAPSGPPLTIDALLAASAGDFRAHPIHPTRPMRPIDFRNVRAGTIDNRDRPAQLILCGEVLAADERGERTWIHFATIQTSGYEQWLGSQAVSFCADPDVHWQANGDLSAALRGRLALPQRDPS